jgi:hypothetical protein
MCGVSQLAAPMGRRRAGRRGDRCRLAGQAQLVSGRRRGPDDPTTGAAGPIPGLSAHSGSARVIRRRTVSRRGTIPAVLATRRLRQTSPQASMFFGCIKADQVQVPSDSGSPSSWRANQVSMRLIKVVQLAPGHVPVGFGRTAFWKTCLWRGVRNEPHGRETGTWQRRITGRLVGDLTVHKVRFGRR